MSPAKCAKKKPEKSVQKNILSNPRKSKKLRKTGRYLKILTSLREKNGFYNEYLLNIRKKPK